MRRDKVLRTWLAGVNPVVDVDARRDRSVGVRNAAVDAGIAKAPGGLPCRWATFDNITREVRPIGECDDRR